MTDATSRTTVWAAAAAIAAFAILFLPVIASLVTAWSTDESYSHGFLVLPLAVWFAWNRRRAAAALPLRPSTWGLVAAAGCMVLLLVGVLAAEQFLPRLALVGTAAAVTLYLFGWAHLRLMAFPLAFLLLMVPLPAILFNQIAFPLQLIASQFGEQALSLLQIPVLREGNVLVLPDTRLEVIEACSGIRSLFSLLTVGLVVGYFSDPRPPARMLIALATVPIAIVANGLRVAGTGLAAHYYGTAAAEGFLHAFSGWLVFLCAFALLLGVTAIVRRLGPAGAATPTLRRPGLEPAA